MFMAKHSMADVSVNKQVDKDRVRSGEQLVYVIAVTNNGPDKAENVWLQDDVPTGLTGTQYSEDLGASWQQWHGNFYLGELGIISTIVLLRGTVSASAGPSISNTAQVYCDTPDPNPQNNIDSALSIVTN